MEPALSSIALCTAGSIPRAPLIIMMILQDSRVPFQKEGDHITTGTSQYILLHLILQLDRKDWWCFCLKAHLRPALPLECNDVYNMDVVEGGH